AGIAADFDALDIGTGALVNQIDHRDGAVVEVTVATRRDFGKGIALGGDAIGNRDDRVLDIPGAVDRTAAGLDQALEGFGVDTGNGAFDADIAEHIALALFNGDGDNIFVVGFIKLGEGGNHAEVG